MNRPQTFSLNDVVSPHIFKDGEHRKRRDDEYVVLNDAQKESFLEYFGYRRHQKTKAKLERFIEHPILNRHACDELGDMIHRITWVGDKFQLYGRQDCEFDANWIVEVIRKCL